MTHINYPLVGDPVYGKQIGIPAKLSDPLKAALKPFRRQALHATALTLTHPVTQETMEWRAPLPDDMAGLLKLLKEDMNE